MRLPSPLLIIMKPKLIIDDAIPFLDRRLEADFDARYLPGELISRTDLRDADALLVRTRTRCDAEMLEDTPVRLVATATIGIDHIDTEWCEEHGIHWLNAPGCNAPAVAQYVFRAISELGVNLDNPLNEAGQPFTLGVVGKGNVGSIVVDWGRRLGFNVIVSDPPRQAAGLTDEDYLPLDELMSRADGVTLHAPLVKKPALGLPSTIHLLDAQMLSRLRPGAILVNAARGRIIDEEALRALKPGRKWRVALDTWEGEPAINPDTLAIADIATFHIAGYSRQGKERATRALLTGLEEEFGVTLHMTDLAAPYSPPESLSEASIRNSYDIMTDDYLMRREYTEFEHLRNFYPLREEVK